LADSHGSGSDGSRPAQEIEEHGFSLVAAVVSEDNEIALSRCKRGMAGTARCRLETVRRTTFDGDAFDGEGDFPVGAETLAERRPMVRVAAEAVVYVQGRETEAGGGCETAQDVK
jgi:hypothetical protein